MKLIQWARNTPTIDLIKYQQSLSKKLMNLTMTKDESDCYEVILNELQNRL